MGNTHVRGGDGSDFDIQKFRSIPEHQRGNFVADLEFAFLGSIRFARGLLSLGIGQDLLDATGFEILCGRRILCRSLGGKLRPWVNDQGDKQNSEVVEVHRTPVTKKDTHVQLPNP
jgi:hypothetical protein